MGGFATYNDGGVGKTTVYADNVDFSGTRTNTVTTNGQLLIGSTAAPNIRVGTLGSTDGSITWTLGAGTITGQVSGGTTVGKTITGNTGGALMPTGGNWNILGNNNADNGFASYNTGSGSTLSTISHGTAKWIVHPTAGIGTHQTITAALASAASGDNVFITPGTYTENFTIPAGVTLVGYGWATSIVGTVTVSTGTGYLRNLHLQSNGATIIALSGTASAVVYAIGCYFNATNGTAITISNTNATSRAIVLNCSGSITAGQKAFALSSVNAATTLLMKDSNFIDIGGVSSTACTADSGAVLIYNTVLANPLSFSGASTGLIQECTYAGGSANTTFITTAGTSSVNSNYNNISTGTASAYSIGSGTTVAIWYDIVNSTNATTVAGSGTLNLGHLGMNNSTAPTYATTLSFAGLVDSIGSGEIMSLDPGATVGPVLSIYRNSASPAANDNLGTIQYHGNSSTGVKRIYSQISSFIDSATNAAENSTLYFFTQQGGTQTQQMRLLSTGGQYRGNNTNTAAPAGYIGEVIESKVASGSAVAMATNTPTNVTSISLTAGQWLISAMGVSTGVTTGTVQDVSISQTSATLATAGDTNAQAPLTSSATADYANSVPAVYKNFASTTTVYLVMRLVYTVGSGAGYGRITATRIA